MPVATTLSRKKARVTICRENKNKTAFFIRRRACIFQPRLGGDSAFLAERLADGSGVTIYFNWPRPMERAEEGACTLALAIVAGTAELAARQKPAAALTASVGIHAARSIVSSMGVSNQPVSQGEAPTAARTLQQQAGPGEVLVSEIVSAAVESWVVHYRSSNFM